MTSAIPTLICLMIASIYLSDVVSDVARVVSGALWVIAAALYAFASSR